MHTLHPYAPHIAQVLHYSPQQITQVLTLFHEGATIPFVCRYRKEATGGLDEVQLAAIQDKYDYFTALDKRKSTILETLERQGNLTDELRKRIKETYSDTLLEDIYLPYKPQKQSRAEKAKRKGLEPLALLLLTQQCHRLISAAQPYVKGDVASVDEALQGAQDIIAAHVAQDEEVRHMLRLAFGREAVITAKVIMSKMDEAEKYKDYFDFHAPLRRCPSHRLLAIRRGESEGLLRVKIALPQTDAVSERISKRFVKTQGEVGAFVAAACEDALERLLLPAMENESATQSKEVADDEAIIVFATNLKQLLLAPPLGAKRTLGLDPGYRTGCKVVCLSAQGDLLHHEAIFPHPPISQQSLAASKLRRMIQQYHIEAIAIGSGTAGRDTYDWVLSLGLDAAVAVFMVSEDGASVYSASAVARQEFPEYDATVRGAVSIGRRLIDPLAELVKIEPKALGIGQYQHDVDAKKLKNALTQTVTNCVNAVGVNVNTAGVQLLTYVAGLGPALAQNIVDYRMAHGPFTNRKQLLQVPRLGNKAYEQCVGFLRITHGDNVLDNTAVHPECYDIVAQMAAKTHCTVTQLIADKAKRSTIMLQDYITPHIGLPTLQDIMTELDKPGRDPRGTAQTFSFDASLRTLENVAIGAIYPGIVTNVTNFGCFVDIGIKQKGLVHISEMSDTFITSPAQVVALHQQVRVRVLRISPQEGRIALSLKDTQPLG